MGRKSSSSFTGYINYAPFDDYDGNELEVEFEVQVVIYAGSPGTYEDPPEGGEVELVSVSGKDTKVTKALYLSTEVLEELQEQAYDHANDFADDADDYDYDREDDYPDASDNRPDWEYDI